MRALFLCLLLAGCGGTEPTSTPGDMAMAQNNNDAGGKPFGAVCAMDSDCATGHCYHGGTSFCTMPCTAATQANDCPKPPTSGMCNLMGYCKP